MADFSLRTERLVLRSWRTEDVPAFHAICSDPAVMATLGPVMDLAATRELVARVAAIEAELGHTFWALERSEDARLIGWCGVIRGHDGPIEGRAEIGWRLASDCWGCGYAIEAARASRDWLFANLAEEAVWAITSVGNARSRKVMDRIGMHYCPDLDFDHPRLATGDPLLRHVTYRLDRSDWLHL